MADMTDPSRSRDELAAEIRRYRYRTWGTQPTPDGRWECFFDIEATRGGSRLRAYGSTEIEAMEQMLAVLAKEGIEPARP
ncbi:MAG: hypothetical protein PVF91_15865 [Chromatiales bacterium]|jgi:hypothetical protein